MTHEQLFNLQRELYVAQLQRMVLPPSAQAQLLMPAVVVSNIEPVS